MRHIETFPALLKRYFSINCLELILLPLVSTGHPSSKHAFEPLVVSTEYADSYLQTETDTSCFHKCNIYTLHVFERFQLLPCFPIRLATIAGMDLHITYLRWSLKEVQYRSSTGLFSIIAHISVKLLQSKPLNDPSTSSVHLLQSTRSKFLKVF